MDHDRSPTETTPSSPPVISNGEEPTSKPCEGEYLNLLSLSNELITAIVGFLPPKDTCSLARTCRRLSDHTRRVLYTDIQLNAVCNLNQFLLTTLSRPEVFDHVRSLDLTIPLNDPHTIHREPFQTRLSTVGIVSKMPRLGHLAIGLSIEITMSPEDWQYQYFEIPMFGIAMPTSLAESLTSCTIEIRNFAHVAEYFVDWCLGTCNVLFFHKPMKRLTLHASTDQREEELPPFGIGKSDTELKELTLIDCYFGPESLSKLLRFPRALESLSIATSFDCYGHRWGDQTSSQGYFDVISNTPAATSLQSLKLDLTKKGKILPAMPGVQKLQGLKYFEVTPHHWEADIRKMMIYRPSDWLPNPIPNNPIEHLLPPNLEVLKVGPSAWAPAKLFELIAAKPKHFQKWRRLIMVLHYRDQASANTINNYLRQVDKDHPGHAHGVQNGYYSEGVDVTSSHLQLECEILPDLKGACDEVGVDLLITYDDFRLHKITGMPPPLWEIPEQIEERIRDTDKTTPSHPSDYCEFPASYTGKHSIGYVAGQNENAVQSTLQGRMGSDTDNRLPYTRIMGILEAAANALRPVGTFEDMDDRAERLIRGWAEEGRHDPRSS